MSRLDPGLTLLSSLEAPRPRWLRDSVFSFARSAAEEERVRILLEFEGNATDLEAVGVRLCARLGTIMTGDIPRHRVTELQRVDGLIRVEAARRTSRELDEVALAVGVRALHQATPPRRGAGVVLAVIDSGIALRHPAFRRPDGTTRVLALWDQGLEAQAHERAPRCFDYGVEYEAAAIDAFLADGAGAVPVRHRDVAHDHHGTMVAGAAAGNGRPHDPAGLLPERPGMAPEADLIVVAYTREHDASERGVGDCAELVDAFAYVLHKAGGRPVVINCSLGETIGPHDGSSLVERAIEWLTSRPGVVVVKSAGNEVGQRRHATQVLSKDQLQHVPFTVPGPAREVVLDLWYDGVDRIEATIVAPDGTELQVRPGDVAHTTAGRTRIAAQSALDDPGNHDNRLFVHLSSDQAVEQGRWALRLVGTDVTVGRWHAWLARECGARFEAPFDSPTCTISVPGTGRSVITVGAHEVKGPRRGELHVHSSQGPTRDGRAAPTLTAPGVRIFAPAPVGTRFDYLEASGTSLAAAVVSGVAALLLEARPTATAAEVRACLALNALRDRTVLGGTPDGWGAGKLDSRAAWEAWDASRSDDDGARPPE